MMVNQKRRILSSQRRRGEVLTIVSGIGVAALGVVVGVTFVAYAGICIAGLGVVSIFWK